MTEAKGTESSDDIECKCELGKVEEVKLDSVCYL